MTGQKIFLDTLNGQMTEKVPFWFMRQAGRYLPEYRALRAEKGGFLQMAFDPRAASEITMQPIRRFGMDAAIIFSDILTVPMALGQKLSFMAGEGPKLDPVDFTTLRMDKFHEVLQPVYDALWVTKNALSGEGFDGTALIGFAGAPWTVAAYMIEGQGSKDFMNAKRMSYEKPTEFGALIDLLIEATAQYLIRQVEAGAEALQIFESWAGALDVDQFERWSIVPTKKIIEKVRKVHPAIPIIGFPRLAGLNILSYAEKTGVNAVGIDSLVPTAWAAENLQARKFVVQGNLDPACLLAGGLSLDHSATSILKDLSRSPFVFNLGHGVNKDTPIAHVERLVQIIQEFKR